MKKIINRIGGPLALILLLTSCAKIPDPTANDPLEGYNRLMFAFNQDADHLIFRPIAKTYSVITPPILQSGVTNMFNNVDEISTLPNDVLQGNFRYIFVDIWRFAINTTLGIGGLFDIATHMGIQPHIETFGLTLAKWHSGKASPYFVIPLLGPSSIQSGLGMAVDYFATPFPYLNNQDINYAYTGLRSTNTRAQLLPADKLVDNAFSPYVFVRDAYLQREKQKISENEALPSIPEKGTK